MAALDPRLLERALRALAEQLRGMGAAFDIVVIGGSALQALGIIERVTRDVDVLALVESDRLVPADPFPPALASARDRVAADLGLSEGWINPGPTSLLDLGLPDGFAERLQRRSCGTHLTIRLPDRIDLIHLKLYAFASDAEARHEDDLRALAPTEAELIAAARWARTQDPSEPFRSELPAVLRYLGVPDASI